MGDHQTQVNSTSPRMSEVTVAEIQKQPIGIEVTYTANVVITTTGVEMIITPSMNAIRGGILIGSTTNLGNGSGGVSVARNLSQSLGPPIATTGVVGTPHMVFTNLIMTTHVNKIAN